MMYIATNQETCEKIGEVLAAQADKPQNIRIFIAGMGCSGPSFGLGLDDANEQDLVETVNGVNFVLEKSVYDTVGEIKIEWVGNGYSVQPVNPQPSSCGSCSSCG
ncbi:MAG: iron-sulfur cluster insertion protein [Clostridiales bacterium]|nr:iron-sulfur cluster insertion protein [Clostridiales bacterium]